jgi:hypothetical protein
MSFSGFKDEMGEFVDTATYTHLWKAILLRSIEYTCLE